MTTAVSVVMAVHNGLAFLEPQLQSVLSQLHHDDEFVIVDDASSDGSYEWLSDHTDHRIVLRRQATNAGVLRTFENGLRQSRHAIIFLCDQDDVWLPGKRDAFTAAFDADPELLAVVSDAELIDGRGQVTAPSFMQTRGGFQGSVWQTLLRNRYLGCAMALRRQLLDAALPIPASAPMHDMWLGALAAALGRTHYLPQVFLQYRRHGGNVSPARHQGILRMARWRWDLLSAVAARRLAIAFGRHGAQDFSAAGSP